MAMVRDEDYNILNSFKEPSETNSSKSGDFPLALSDELIFVQRPR